jgi:hypothetical protein
VLRKEQRQVEVRDPSDAAQIVFCAALTECGEAESVPPHRSLRFAIEELVGRRGRESTKAGKVELIDAFVRARAVARHTLLISPYV